jgi:hypothetical protein
MPRQRAYPRKTTGVDECSIPGCEKLMFARTWCSAHYTRWYNHGDPLGGSWPKTAEERFWPKVDRRGENECWPWLAYLNKDGYGQFVGGGEVLSHRFAYISLVGPIPEGLTLDHLCRNRWCQNPKHLEAVTMRENARRGESIPAQNARKTHCKHGHQLSGDNLYLYENGKQGRPSRRCKTCLRDNARRYAERKRKPA